MQKKRKQNALRDCGNLEVSSEEKMFKIRPTIARGVKQVENGVKSTVRRHSSMSKYPGAGKGWVLLSNTKASVARTVVWRREHGKIRLSVGRGQMIQSFVNHVNLIVPKFVVKLATI